VTYSSMLSPHKRRNLTPVLSTDQEMARAGNVIDTHAQYFMVNGELLVTHPESICSLHSFTARYSKCLMFSISMEQYSSLSLLSNPYNQQSPAPRQTRQLRAISYAKCPWDLNLVLSCVILSWGL
jgi:hypothetical protein